MSSFQRNFSYQAAVEMANAAQTRTSGTSRRCSTWRRPCGSRATWSPRWCGALCQTCSADVMMTSACFPGKGAWLRKASVTCLIYVLTWHACGRASASCSSITSIVNAGECPTLRVSALIKKAVESRSRLYCLFTPSRNAAQDEKPELAQVIFGAGTAWVDLDEQCLVYNCTSHFTLPHWCRTMTTGLLKGQ